MPSGPALDLPAADFLADAPERDLYQLAAELKPDSPQNIPRVVNAKPFSFDEGRKDTFWLIDLPSLKVYQSEFELRLISPHAYWYVEEGQVIRQQALKRSATIFEEDIYPRVTGAFGEEWSPGVDGDPHINILNAGLRGTGGYFTSNDEYPRSVTPFSNQREVIYINTSAFPVANSSYLRTLAHELQHLIHWNADPSEETWINEGLAELAATVAGYSPDTIYRFLQSGPTSLVHWPLSPSQAGANYGAASLFMHYLSDHYGTPNGLRALLEEPADGIAGIDAYLESLGSDATFRDVFRDWIVANLLDQPQGPYGYSDLEVRTRVRSFVDKFSDFSSEIPQYSAEYIELTDFARPFRLRFRGSTENTLLPVDVGHQGCWWSNSGDSINSTLSRSIDLKGLEQATLSYQVWYNLEEQWDYTYVEASLDGGRKWDILEAPSSSPKNPVGNSYGMGYTGDSQGWISESVDLTPYAGQEIRLRFQYITDDAINGAGLCLRQIAIPQAGLLELRDGWQADGFILVNNRVRQDYIVQVIEFADEPRVTLIPLDETNAGEILIAEPEQPNRLVVAVAALAPKTLQPASYTLSVEPVN